MKVLQINAVYGFASTGEIIRDIGDALKSNGHEVRFAYQQGQCDANEGYRIGSPLDWKLHALFTRLTGMQGWASRHATQKLLAYINTEKPDVVHLHNLHASYVNLPMLLNYLAEKKIATVVTLHDCWFFTGKCCHFVSADCEKWKTGCGNCPKRNENPSSWLLDRSAPVAKQKAELFHKLPNLTVVGCSRWIAGLARQSLVFRGCRVEQIYNGVDTKIFTPLDRDVIRQQLGFAGQFVILGFAGKWLDKRNQLVFQKIIAELSPGEQIVLIGCSDSQKKQMKPFPKIHAVGFIQDRQELARYYNAADVFVNLTLEDTLPTVNMEAICCGTPVITYDTGGSPELVMQGKTGAIVPQLDYKALQSAIHQQKSDFSRPACRQQGETNFGKAGNYQRYLSLYTEITARQ